MSSSEVAELRRHPIDIVGFVVSLDDVFVSQTLVTDMPTDQAEGFTAILDTTLSTLLVNKGDVREVISFIQKLRKSSKFKVTDHITVTYSGDEAVQKLLSSYQEDIKKQVLAIDMKHDSSVTDNSLTISTGMPMDYPSS